MFGPTFGVCCSGIPAYECQTIFEGSNPFVKYPQRKKKATLADDLFCIGTKGLPLRLQLRVPTGNGS